MKTKIHYIKNATEEQIRKINEAVNVLEKILNSDRFKNEFFKLKLTNTNGMSNQEIWEIIVGGVEAANPEENSTIDLNIEIFKSDRAKGTAHPSSNRVRLDKDYVSSTTIANIAKTIMHEWLHNLGFEHKLYEYSSVPFAVGKLVREMASNPAIPFWKKPIYWGVAAFVLVIIVFTFFV